MQIEEAAALLTASLADVPSHARSMNIVNSWVDGQLHREIHVAFKASYKGRAVPTEYMGHPVKRVEFQP